ncbi:glycerophosphoryl diester phosphodiesterase [Parapedobacter pyrenivorans]|uniref:Glycerophosphoryl diester phosphodiesterase n=2 Tax=Parapedobacter pyrenivorans TaxID=1305674 RepID=A0A917HU84_9SPHI|nr:glycerophosphoryl diester phosphodiesterase [Parapedobacter pyrenivorans]
MLLAGASPGNAQEPMHTMDFQHPNALKAFLRYQADRPVLISAHRGGAAPGYPENSIHTFARTLSYTPAFMEVDPRYTKDGQVVLLHDDTLSRMTTGRGKVIDYTLAELRQLYLKDVDGRTTPFAVNTLAEALQWAKGKTVLILDQKGIPALERARLLVMQNAKAHAMLIVYSVEDAAAVYRYDPEIMMEVMVPSLEALAAFQAAGVPMENIVAFVGHKPPKDPAVVVGIQEVGVTPARGTSFELDRAYTSGRISRGELHAGYLALVASGVAMLESDLATEAGMAVQAAWDADSQREPPKLTADE